MALKKQPPPRKQSHQYGDKDRGAGLVEAK